MRSTRTNLNNNSLNTNANQQMNQHDSNDQKKQNSDYSRYRLLNYVMEDRENETGKVLNTDTPKFDNYLLSPDIVAGCSSKGVPRNSKFDFKKIEELDKQFDVGGKYEACDLLNQIPGEQLAELAAHLYDSPELNDSIDYHMDLIRSQKQICNGRFLDKLYAFKDQIEEYRKHRIESIDSNIEVNVNNYDMNAKVEKKSFMCPKVSNFNQSNHLNESDSESNNEYFDTDVNDFKSSISKHMDKFRDNDLSYMIKPFVKEAIISIFRKDFNGSRTDFKKMVLAAFGEVLLKTKEHDYKDFMNHIHSDDTSTIP